MSGRYVRAEHWQEFDEAQQHGMRAVAAVSLLDHEVVVSHASAAALWGLPRLGHRPERVQVTDPTVARSTSKQTTYRHAGSVPHEDVREVGGVLVTSPVRTAVDLSLRVPLRQAVVALDHGLRVGLFSKDDLSDHLDRRTERRGRVMAGKAIAFADGRADRPGESLSRVVMHESRLTPPELQYEFRLPGGRRAFVDSFWPQWGIVGEFDGFVKYRDAGLRRGLSAEDVVVAEKLREDLVRRHPEVKAFVRWVWRDAMRPGNLGRLLADAGVR
ncbi:hypothetical protein GCM10025780_11000 [Frondihabitans cladoniiphilus]|uniref:Transcriptional regulator, AbiEi antitoxin, Type IV TA system n=1 Tax=Frondihabitans cladoniiphilus TaxID=715785 RepID=A0ABP8VR17_9MICO